MCGIAGFARGDRDSWSSRDILMFQSWLEQEQSDLGARETSSLRAVL
jgi:hypothetical protein